MKEKCPICESGTLSSVEGRGEWGDNGPSKERAHAFHYSCGHIIAAPSKGFWETVLSDLMTPPRRTAMKKIECSYCKHEFCSPEDFKFYGISGTDLFKMIQWLKLNNATIADLEDSILNYKFWRKQTIYDAMFEKES